MAEEGKNREARREPEAEEEPQVYALRKDLTGWRFSRRDFLAAAGTAAGAAVAGATAGCGPATPTATPQPTPTLSPEEKARMEACQDVRAHMDSVMALAVSLDGTLLASASEDKTVKLWSLPEGALVKTLEGHTDWVRAMVVSPDGTLLASAGKDKTLKLWPLPEGALVKTLEGHRPAINALAVNPDGTLLASASDDNTVRLWSLPEGALVKTLEGHRPAINALAVSPDGTLLASASKDKTVKLWSLPEGTFASCLVDLKANERDVKGATYKVETASGQTVEYTLPCGAPIPPGAVCTCNCVAGSYGVPSCTCVGHTAPCTCVGYTAPRESHYWYPT